MNVRTLGTLILTALALLVPAVGLGATVEVRINGIRSAAGTVSVELCSKSRFLGETCEFNTRVVAVEGGVSVVFDNVPPGVWAMQSYHDEKSLGYLLKGLFGIPKYGVALSNDARGRLGPPSFEDASFTLSGDQTGSKLIVAQIHY